MLVDKKRYMLRLKESALKEKYCLECKKPFCAFCDTEVEDAPTIDAVEVVRCKDCAKREYCRTTNVWATVPGDDWFCADAERRSDV